MLREKKKKKNKLFVLGMIVVTIGIILGVIPIIVQIYCKAKEKENIENFFQKEGKQEEQVIINQDDIQLEPYLMVLEIPKLQFQRGIFYKESKYNNISYNVMIMSESSMPDEKNSNLVLAAHSGNADISYFDSLYQMTYQDIAIIYYKNVKYTYEVEDIYDVLKDGDVEVKRDMGRKTLTLITCKRDTSDRQFVLILYLKSMEDYE